MVYQQPSIFIGNLRIDEPVTVLTDLLVSAVCFFAAVKVGQAGGNERTGRLLMYYFLTMGLATMIGGIIGHGFLYYFGFVWKLPGWLTSMLSIMLLERASILYARPFIKPTLAKIFIAINFVELIIFVILTFSTLNFFFVEVHSAYGLLVVTAGFHGYVYWKSRSVASKYFLFAVGISALSALIFMNKIGISPWFTHYDISHMIMALSAYVFYLGSMKIFSPS